MKNEILYLCELYRVCVCIITNLLPVAMQLGIHYSTAGSSSCIKCPAGSYSDTLGIALIVRYYELCCIVKQNFLAGSGMCYCPEKPDASSTWQGPLPPPCAWRAAPEPTLARQVRGPEAHVVGEDR